MAGLTGLTLWLLWSPPAGESVGAGERLAIGTACAAPLLVLLAQSLRNDTQWGKWVAVVMVPYVALSVGAMLVTPDGRWPGAVFAAVAVLVFFAGIDTARRR